jgi:tetratricopeptide (TPR) repeat protein
VEYRTPNSTETHQYSGLVDLAEKRYPEAISEFLIVASAGHDEPDEWALLAYAYAQGGRRREAMDALAHLDRLERKRLVPVYWKALAWTGLGDYDRAMYFLNEAYRLRSSQLPGIQSSPLF